jgi:nucleoside-diphosphate-sugar epimerase
MTPNNENQKILLLGFGDIAKRVATYFHKKSPPTYDITGVCRRADSYLGVNVRQLDAIDEKAMLALTRENFDIIVITMTPDEMNDGGYQRAYVEPVKTLIRTLEKNTLTPQLIIFVSSSSVYGQSDNEWVNECSETQPASFSGRRLLEAENLLTNSVYTSCIIRFSGIYGMGRKRLIEQVRAGNVVEQAPVLYSNRIHSDDCAGVIGHLIERQQRSQKIETLYLATDCQPSPIYDVKQWLGVQLGLVNNPLAPRMPDSRAVSPELVNVQSTDSKVGGQTSRGSKRCSNQRLLDSGYRFLYPTFKEGYRVLLDNLE